MVATSYIELFTVHYTNKQLANTVDYSLYVTVNNFRDNAVLQVHLGVRQCILMSEDGQNMNDTCSINYYI